jgi:hypothetical protein
MLHPPSAVSMLPGALHFGMVVRVYDGKTLKSVPGMAVKVWGSDVHSITDERGLCQLLWLRPGRYTLTVDSPNYFPARRLVLFEPQHASNRFDIRLQHREFYFPVESGSK